MKRVTRFRRRRGATLPLVALCLTVLLCFSSLAVDVTFLYLRKSKHQVGCDAAARAGALALPDAGLAEQRALLAASENGVDPAGVTVTFPGDGQVSVRTTEEAPTFLAGVFGVQGVNVGSSAAAVNGPTGTIRGRFPAGLRPWALDASALPTDLRGSAGTPVTLAMGQRAANGDVITPGSWYPVRLAGAGSGQDPYLEDLRRGTAATVSVGDEVELEPEELTDVTVDAVRELLERAAAAPWSDQDWKLATPLNPRVVLVPVVDWSVAGNGQTRARISSFAALYLEEMTGTQLTARFLHGVNVANGAPVADAETVPDGGVRTVRLTD